MKCTYLLYNDWSRQDIFCCTKIFHVYNISYLILVLYWVYLHFLYLLLVDSNHRRVNCAKKQKKLVWYCIYIRVQLSCVLLVSVKKDHSALTSGINKAACILGNLSKIIELMLVFWKLSFAFDRALMTWLLLQLMNYFKSTVVAHFPFMLTEDKPLFSIKSIFTVTILMRLCYV